MSDLRALTPLGPRSCLTTTALRSGADRFLTIHHATIQLAPQALAEPTAKRAIWPYSLGQMACQPVGQTLTNKPLFCPTDRHRRNSLVYVCSSRGFQLLRVWPAQRLKSSRRFFRPTTGVPASNRLPHLLQVLSEDLPETDRLRWLKEFNHVTRRVRAENLFASRPLHNIVSEPYTRIREL